MEERLTGVFLEDFRARVKSSNLDDFSKRIIWYRFGLEGDGRIRTIEEVAEYFGMDREQAEDTVRKAESSLLATRCFHWRRSPKDDLKDYLE